VHVLDAEKVARRLKDKGWGSLTALAHALGLHRNTLHYYLSGKPVFSAALEKLFAALDLDPAVAVVKKSFFAAPGEIAAIAPLVDTLHAAFPQTTYVLFGSRAEGCARRYSDFDIGVFAAVGLKHELFRKLLRIKTDWEEDSPYFIDLVNLDRADPEFLRRISRGWKFLAGRQQDWMMLQNKAAA
jgi:hypothetical protein